MHLSYKAYFSKLIWACCAIVAAFSQQHQGAAEMPWELLSGLKGAEISDLEVSKTNPDHVLATVNGGGVYKSVDGGLNWKALSSGYPDLWTAWNLEVDPTDSQVLYVGTWDKGLFRSDDSGASWSAVSNSDMGPNAWALRFDPENPNDLYVGTTSGLWVTSNAGRSWERRNSGMSWNRIRSIAFDALHPGRIYAGTIFGSNNQVYRSDDYGASWKSLSLGIDPRSFVHDLEVDQEGSLYAATDSGIFLSENGGQTWEKFGGEAGEFRARGLNLEFGANSEPTASTWSGLVTLSKNSRSASLTASVPFHNQFPTAMATASAERGRIYVGVFGGVYRSSDGGKTWELHNNGLPQRVTVSNENIIIDPRNSKNIFVGTYAAGVFGSTDAGESWTNLSNGLTIAVANGAGRGISDAHGKLILFIGIDGAGLFRSLDEGKSWQPVNEGITNFLPLALEPSPEDSSILYLGTGGGAFKSTNFGANWTAVSEGLPEDAFVEDFAIHPSDPSVIYAALGRGGVYRSKNSGESWERIDQGLPTDRIWCINVRPDDPNIVYVGTFSEGAFRSADGGVTWTEINSGLAPDLKSKWVFDFSFAPEKPDEILAAVDGAGVYKTVDGGDSWKPLNEGLDNLVIYALQRDPNEPSTIYLGTGAGLFRLTGQ